MLPHAAGGETVRIIPFIPAGSLKSQDFGSDWVFPHLLQLITRGKGMLPVITFGKTIVPTVIQFRTFLNHNGPNWGSNGNTMVPGGGKTMRKVTVSVT